MSSEEFNEDLAFSIGRVVRIARQRHEYTQETAANKVGISPAFYARIERGQALPSVTTLVGIANALGVTLDEMLGVHDDRPPPREPPIADRTLRKAVQRIRTASPGARRLVMAVVKLLEKKRRRARDS